MRTRYNGGEWTQAKFNSYIRSALRTASVRWAPRYKALADAYVDRRINIKTGKLAKHFKCASCLDAFPQKDVAVDHIEPIGDFISWDIVVDKMFCESDNLQVLCKDCHGTKTKMEREAARVLKTVLREEQNKDKSTEETL